MWLSAEGAVRCGEWIGKVDSYDLCGSNIANRLGKQLARIIYGMGQNTGITSDIAEANA